ncbi:MAG: nadB [Haloplasmataceae bacterium]|nr:nadB [Haloplasmataceae bacterium]
MEKYDVIVVGSGLAGLYTALNVTRRKKVLLITKDKLNLSNSFLAQGGIAGELFESDESYQKHIDDTLIAGSYLNDVDALKVLVYESSHNLNKLINYGVNFDKDANGNILLTREGGHSERRILHAGGDATGKAIVDSLIPLVMHKANIDILEYSMVIDLIIQEDQCIGVKVLNDNKIKDITAPFTVLCTGGIGDIYKNTTNPIVAKGDGIAIAHRAGAKIENMEFIQFHPTAFFNKETGPRFLISEAMRGEGGTLLNVEGHRFMHKYHLLLELAPRDIVSQSIYREMYDTWSDHVYLDVRHLDPNFLQNRFPTIYNRCLENGIDITKDLIPVSPVEHFSCGGIVVDLKGETTIKNLFASGECADSGVHGANRLASNSLLECTVWGRRIAKYINELDTVLDRSSIVEEEVTISNYTYRDIRLQIKDIMERYVGIVRTEKNLISAKEVISKILNDLKKDRKSCMAYFELLNMATVSMIIIESALNRKESVGCHYRID